jgi:gamma-glutamylcysteine synthetase
MNRSSIRQCVSPLFARGPRRATAVGIEQELFAMDFIGGGCVAPTRVGDVIQGRDYAGWVSFEPGGQVELSLPVAPTAAAASIQLERVTSALAADLMACGIVLAATPVRSQGLAVPRFLYSHRYDAMERHLDSVGPAGRRMMRATASTQICLDWWPGRTGFEQWRVLLLAAPFLAAATARSAGPRGRLATWLEVDPSRTAFDDRLLHGDDPVAAYADFAAGAAVFVDGGVVEHLTTLFPPVRPRGRYLEVRFPDARPARDVAALATGLARLLYDDDQRRTALTILAGEQTRLPAHWAAAGAGVLDPEIGLRLLRWMDRPAVAA